MLRNVEDFNLNFAESENGEISALFTFYNEISRKQADNFYFHISKLNKDGFETNSIKSKQTMPPTSAKAFFTKEDNIYVAAYYGNDLYLLYTAHIKDKPLITSKKQKYKSGDINQPRKGACYLMKINKNGQAQRKMIWDYKTDDQLFYPISYPINEHEIGVFKANKDIITTGKADIRF